MRTILSLVGSLISSPAKPESISANVEDFPVKIGHSGVGMDEMGVDSLVEVFATHILL